MRQVVISIEATRVEASEGAKIIEIGCVEILDSKISGNTFHVYLNPKCLVDQASIEKHGITNEYLADKPVFNDVVGEFLDFIGDAQLVTYNAGHVIPFLHKELIALEGGKHGRLKNDYIDILTISNKRHPNQNNSLDNLTERYYLDSSQFNGFGALFKAEIIANLLLALIDESTKNITSDTEQFEIGENLTVVETFSDFDIAIEGIGKTALCRGVSNHEYPLLPSLFRHNEVKLADTREFNSMWVFKTHAKPHLDVIPLNDIEWLTIAQHHGLPTRLLDWSLSPLVACFFAVQSLTRDDAAVFIYDIGKFKKEEEIKLSELKEITAFFPSHATKRITSQSGMFTIHPTASMKLEPKSLKKILIPASRKKYFLEKLVKYGVHHGTIFPDLDGLSSYVRYLNNYR
ncbi:FRG domain-containing protein [Paraglaciecola aquimarina]|uniref:DNA-directed DNA polymerase n=1 Tax=Paraglaciecola algarum TaxID=3050085 RepID=A0ABS9D8Z8_9ALTE|nr:FRG domain-containing protein [Paraglaciecola sp. G1-23]MCF2949270.1 FRG domain-containing protein [Paraglaciecola sp. G1-23]